MHARVYLRGSSLNVHGEYDCRMALDYPVTCQQLMTNYCTVPGISWETAVRSPWIIYGRVCGSGARSVVRTDKIRTRIVRSRSISNSRTNGGLHSTPSHPPTRLDASWPRPARFAPAHRTVPVLNTVANGSHPPGNKSAACCIVYFLIKESKSRMASEILMKGDPVPFARSMGRLINCKEFSDVKFIVGEARQHIFAHRCILVSRCEVFRAMFAEKVVKETSAKIPLVLSDVESDIFMIILEFIYTNCASLSAKTVVDVLASSIEYGLDELRKLCNAYLIRNLSVTTACETMQAAATYGQDDLRWTTMGFIEEHTVEVFKMKQFQELSEQALAVILQSSRLLMDEMDILAAVKEWASINSAVQGVSLLKAISSVIRHVRFPLFNEAELQRVESDNEAQNVVPIAMIAFAWKFHALHQSDGTNPQTKLRRGTKHRDSHQGLTPWDH